MANVEIKISIKRGKSSFTATFKTDGITDIDTVDWDEPLETLKLLEAKDKILEAL